VLSIADAWMILNAAVGTGNYCRLSACDINGDGIVQTRDAIAVLRAMAGIEDEDVFDCRASVAFGIDNAVNVDHVAFVVDYSNAGVAFTNKFEHVRCRGAEGLTVSRLEVNDDPIAQVLSLKMDFTEAISGSLGVAECFVRPPEGGKLPGPGAYVVVVTELGSNSDGRLPTTVSVLPGG
jgi:hypothetical protein